MLPASLTARAEKGLHSKGYKRISVLRFWFLERVDRGEGCVTGLVHGPEGDVDRKDSKQHIARGSEVAFDTSL